MGQAHPATDYLRKQFMPHIWCAGCGHGIVMGAVVRAIDRVGLEKDRVVVVSGIGCSSRAPGYLDFDTLHTTHGRALAFATGIKMARPELKVIVLTGDGDAAAIGGNHLIHAARRNIGITTICFNNSIYGMTSGQYSPLTPFGSLASTAPYGNIDPAFDLSRLVQAAGASFVARATTYHVTLLIDLISKALKVDGFAFVEALSQCPTYYGRRNKMRSALEMLRWYRDNSVMIQGAAKMSQEELAGKVVIGELHRVEGEEYTRRYEKVIEIAQARALAGTRGD